MAPATKDTASNGEGMALLAARLATSSFVQETSTVHVLPSTSNPAAFGLFGLAICNALHMGPYLGITDATADNLMFAFALFFGGLGQMLAGWLEFQRKNTWACVTWLSYSGYWMGYGISGLLNVYAGQGDATYVNGSSEGWQLANCLWGIMTFILFLGTFCLNGVLCVMMGVLTIQFFLEAASCTHHGSALYRATGVAGWIVSALAFYIGVSVLFQEMYNREILPLFPLDWEKVRGRRSYGVTGTRRDLAPKLEEEQV